MTNNPNTMTRFQTVLALLASLMVVAPAWSQNTIDAPTGWTRQARAGGAVTYTPPDLAAGESYSVTLYDSAPLQNKTLKEWVRAFAGPVGKTTGQLNAPLLLPGKGDGRVVVGSGTYNGPNGAGLGVVFFGMSLDGTRIHVERVLFSGKDVFDRYQTNQDTLFESLAKRASAEAGDRAVTVPSKVREHLTPGGELVPGVYAGERYTLGKLSDRFRLHLYPDGQYRLCDENDKDIQTRGFRERAGQVSYNRLTGQLTVDSLFDLANGYDYQHCYYGRDAVSQPVIYNSDGVAHSVTELRYVGANTKRLAPKAEHAREAALRAEEARYKFVTLPGRGLKDAQIAAILQRSQAYQSNEVYVLLRDGAVHDGLPPVALDQFDMAASKRKEPEAWGRWRAKGEEYQVSFAGKPFETWGGNKVLPVPPGLRLGTHFEGANATLFSYSIFGVTFDKAGRFATDSRGGVSVGPGAGGMEGSVTATTTWDEGGVSSTASVAGGVSTQGGTLFSSNSKKKNPRGNREGTYSFNGYTLTLRYDNGTVERIPTFFLDKEHEMLWFQGAWVLSEKQ